MKTFYIDCTYTFSSGGMRGVPRVVRNLIAHADLANSVGLCAQPVIVDKDRYVAVSQHELDARFSAADISQSRLYQYGYRVFVAMTNLVIAFVPHPAIRSFFTADIRQPGLASWINRFVLGPIRKARARFMRISPKEATRTAVNFQPGDILFTPDCVWSYEYREALLEAKSRGVRAILLSHDIMPVSHPQWCRSSTYRVWLDGHLPLYDAVVANSRYTLESVQNYLQLIGQEELVNRLRWTYFTLGSSLNVEPGNQRASAQVESLLSRDYYLTVSAIEPRKNHELLLDAFELMWSAGRNVTMVWVGKWTWNSESLRQRVLSHPEYGKRLFVLDYVSDTDLACLYLNAKAMLFPSWVEGFGLPIAEAMAMKLPIIVSDIHIHREVAGDTALYFSPADLMELCFLIKGIEEGTVTLVRPAGSVITWREAVADLFSKIHGLDL